MAATELFPVFAGEPFIGWAVIGVMGAAVRAGKFTLIGSEAHVHGVSPLVVRLRGGVARGEGYKTLLGRRGWLAASCLQVPVKRQVFAEEALLLGGRLGRLV